MYGESWLVKVLGSFCLEAWSGPSNRVPLNSGARERSLPAQMLFVPIEHRPNSAFLRQMT